MPGSITKPKVLLLLMCLSILGISGCFTAKRPAFHFADVASARPVVPVLLPTGDNSWAEPPDIAQEIAPMPPYLAGSYPGPARPHVAPAPSAEPAPIERPSQPMIVPELSSEELASAKDETNRSLSAAQHNLALTEGKELNSAQSDLASKVRGFMETARDAVRNSDWLRARNLAKKAEVLSDELARSL